jgi:hypothetical protein
MLALTNHTQCFNWETPLIYQSIITNEHIQNSQKKTEDYSILPGLGRDENNSPDLSFKNFKEKSFKHLNTGVWPNKALCNLVENLKKLDDDEITYIVYETLGRDYLEKKDYDAAILRLRQGIKKREPACMKLLKELAGLPHQNDIDALDKDLKTAVEKRIQGLTQNDSESKDSQVPIKHLQQRITHEQNLPLIFTVVLIEAVSFFAFCYLTNIDPSIWL